MKYLVKKSFIQVLGYIWMPNTLASYEYPLTASDVENAKDDEGKLTRESVESWLAFHSGDFRLIEDFSADLEDGETSVVFDWSKEENENIYNDLTYGDATDFAEGESISDVESNS